MGHTMYLECYSGISGDMTVAALLDLGADKEVLLKVLESLPVQGFRVEINRVMKSGIDACDFNVILEEQDNHDHDMEYLYGHMYGEEHSHEHTHEVDNHSQEHNHTHEAHNHSHEHIDEHHHAHHDNHNHSEGHHHHHVHRGMKEIREIVNQGDMTERAKELTLRIFTILAEAESKAHNVPVEDVHFHEVGAIDSIVDIVAIAVCMDNLDITNVIVPELWEGRGTVRCQHGILPVPVPAVCNIMQAHGLPVRITEIMGELITPTGAAAVAAVQTSNHLPKSFSIKKIGLGAGKRQYECPGILRAMLIEENPE